MVRRVVGEDAEDAVEAVGASSGVVDADGGQGGIRRGQAVVVVADRDSYLVVVLDACTAPSGEIDGEQEGMYTSQMSCCGYSHFGRGSAVRAAFCRDSQGDLVAEGRLRWSLSHQPEIRDVKGVVGILGGVASLEAAPPDARARDE